MNFTQIVYYTDKPIIITNDTEGYKNSHPQAAGYAAYAGLDATGFADALTKLRDTNMPGALFQEPSAESLLMHLGSAYTIIQAGGGLVYNDKGEILLIFRRGKWDLPKGKLDKGETIEECSVREVEEETGITGLTLGTKICETWHVYDDKGRNLVKHTTWFKMRSSDTRTLVPQIEEDIVEVRWADTKALLPYVSNTYHAIKDVLIHEGLL